MDEKYTFVESSGWIEDKNGNIICQFWDKCEDDFINRNKNGQRIADLLNGFGLEDDD